MTEASQDATNAIQAADDAAQAALAAAREAGGGGGAAGSLPVLPRIAPPRAGVTLGETDELGFHVVRDDEVVAEWKPARGW